jgi:hypothetical protein
VTVTGQLRIVPSSNLGDLGPQQGQAEIFNWKWYYSATGSVIWLALILAIFVPKSNRKLCVLRIFIPLGVVLLLWSFYKWFIDMTSSEAKQWDLLLQSFVISLVILWLLAKQFDTFSGFVRCFLAIGVFAVVTVLDIISNYLGFFRESIILVVFLISSGLILLFAMIAASKLCKGLYLPKRFMLWLVLFMPVCGIIAMIGCVIVSMIIMHSVPPLKVLLSQVPIIGLCFGLLIYVVNLPFMILMFGDPFFRERFCACLNLKSMPAVADSDLNKQDE